MTSPNFSEDAPRPDAPAAGTRADAAATSTLTRSERQRVARSRRVRRRVTLAGSATAAFAVVAGVAVAQAATLPSADAESEKATSVTADATDRTQHATRDLQRTALTGTPVAKRTTATSSTKVPAGAVRVVASSWDVDTSATVTSGATVASVLKAQGVKTDADDKIALAPPTAAHKKLGFTATVVVHRVDVKNVASRTTDKSATIVRKDSSRLASAGTKTVRAGKDGVRTVVRRVTTVDGKVTARKTVKTSTTAVDAVVVKGTKKAPKQTPKKAAVVTTASGAQGIAQQMVAARGWGSEQFTCLVNLWNRESGWNVSATNPSSGAYGIPQSLPGNKMATAGSDWQTNATTQITWGLGYIASAYGTPCGAWGHSQATGWY